MPRCPKCNSVGRKVRRTTLESLLRPKRRGDIGAGPYHVCTAPGCQAVYFGAGDDRTFFTSDLVVRFGLKETGPPRPVCYCFDHTIEQIHDEIRRTGRSTVLDSIEADMKKSGCRCDYTNPLGGCCLNTVEQVVQEGFRVCETPDAVGTILAFVHKRFRGGKHLARSDDAATEVCSRSGCCEVADPADPVGPREPGLHTGLWAVGGSVLSAALSSACCWLPLLLIAFGASAAGVAGFFERQRPFFIAAAVVLLSAGYYTVYVRRARWGPGSACATPNRKLRVFNKAMLWMATALVATFVFFPNYVGRLLGGPAPETALVADTRLVAAEFHIEGMTCAGCADVLRGALAKLPDVAGVDVDYLEETAIVRFKTDKPVAPDRVIEAVKVAGYGAVLSREVP